MSPPASPLGPSLCQCLLQLHRFLKPIGRKSASAIGPFRRATTNERSRYWKLPFILIAANVDSHERDLSSTKYD